MIIPASSWPRLGFGGAGIGNLYEAVSDAEAQAALAAASRPAPGEAWIDTAPFYGHGLSERRIGEHLRRHRAAGVRLSTKVGRRLDLLSGPQPEHGFVDTDPATPVFDYSFDGVLRTFDASLERLGVERVDLLLLHDIGALTHGPRHAEVMAQVTAQAWPAMLRLREEDRVGALGIGVNEVAVAVEALNRFALDAVLIAGRYTLMDRSAELSGLLAAARDRGTRVLAAAPFNSGLLAGGAHFDYAPASPQARDAAARLSATCRAFDVPLGAAALQFPLRHPAVAGVLAGARSAAEVEQHRAWMDMTLPDALWAALDDAA